MGHGVGLTCGDGGWEVRAGAKPVPNPAANPGKALLDVKIAALYDADHDAGAPHGLIGQSYDGDSIAVDGAQDSYTGREVTTKAMAEGAIEGVAADYQMASKLATAFKYSRFDASSAQHPDGAPLTRRKTARASTGGTVGATADVAADVVEVA